MPKIFKSYLFGKPEYVKQYEKRQKAKAAGKKQKPKAKHKAPAADPWKRTRTKIDYLNERIRKYGDPDHVMSLLPSEMITEAGRIRNTPESRAFFLQHPELLPRIQQQIKKHPVTSQIRDAFEAMLGSIYDEMQEIGKTEFFRITGTEFRGMLGDPSASNRQKTLNPALKGTDADTDKKMQEIIEKWASAKQKIAQYYEEQVRQGKMPAFSDDNPIPTTD